MKDPKILEAPRLHIPCSLLPLEERSGHTRHGCSPPQLYSQKQADGRTCFPGHSFLTPQTGNPYVNRNTLHINILQGHIYQNIVIPRFHLQEDRGFSIIITASLVLGSGRQLGTQKSHQNSVLLSLHRPVKCHSDCR